MTRIDFHSGVADKLDYACRLVRKAWRSGHRVVVTGAPEPLARLDVQLWTFDPGDFIPHARLRAGAAMPARLARTPIWLADRATDLPEPSGMTADAACVLVNLGPELPPGYERFPRVIELVARSDDEVGSGRQRWRQYVAAGLVPTNHPQAGAG